MEYIIRNDGTVWRKGTLAHALDTRKISLGEPSAEDLPKTINPLELFRSLLGSHLVVVHIPSTAIQNDLTYCFPLLKLLTPPGEAVVVVKEVAPVQDTMRISSSDVCGTARAVHFTTTYKGVRS